MTLVEIRQMVDRVFDGDLAAIDWFMENDLMLVDMLLDVADAARVAVDDKRLASKDSVLAETLEELELEPWVSLPTVAKKSDKETA